MVRCFIGWSEDDPERGVFQGPWNWFSIVGIAGDRNLANLTYENNSYGPVEYDTEDVRGFLVKHELMTWA